VQNQILRKIRQFKGEIIEQKIRKRSGLPEDSCWLIGTAAFNCWLLLPNTKGLGKPEATGSHGYMPFLSLRF